MKSVLLFGMALLCSTGSFSQSAPKREMRGAWIATFSGIDWPNRTQTPTQQRAALITILDHHKATGLNTVYLQVRSQCDALYPSPIEPWSADLTGTSGKAPNPLWDPLQFAIDECHKRGLELHAWVNPYRAVATASTLPGFAASHVAKQHPEWLLNNGSTITLNPGLAPVRDYILSVLTDLLHRYDVDGLHFDDYFYPPAPFNDDSAYNADKRGFPSSTAGRADWRRDNINILVKRVYDSVLAIRPWTKFGISPSGIYRSSTNPAIGSNTSAGASQHYSAVYADSKKWLQEGWVDYIEPQVYWFRGQAGSDYSILIPWWNNNAFGRHIYIGMAGYKVLNTTGWGSRSEIPEQVKMNRANANIKGQAIYNTNSLRTNSLNFRDSLRLSYFNLPALQPTMPWRDATPPAAPSNLLATRFGNDSVVLAWTLAPNAVNELDKAKRYVVYRSVSAAIDRESAASILAITPDATGTFTDRSVSAGTTYYYTVTALDRFQNESAPSNTTDYAPPTIACPGADTIFATGSCTAALPDYRSSATVSDDVTPSSAIVVTQSPVAGTPVSGETTVTLTARDASGKTASCSVTVTTIDAEPPVLTGSVGMGSTVTVSADAGSCSFTAGTGLDISATDNCGAALTSIVRLSQDTTTVATLTGSSLAGAVFSKGLTKVEWVVTDAAGNASSYFFTVSVIDTEAPQLAAPADRTVSTDSGICAATLVIDPPAASDQCGPVTVSGVRGDGLTMSAPYPKGATILTWTATDEAGNTTQRTQTIHVVDTEAPVITNAAASTEILFPANHKMRNVTISYDAADNCGPVTTTLSVSSNEPESGSGDGDDEAGDWVVTDNHRVKLRAERAGGGDGRVYTVTITATDAAGNQSTQAVLVTVPHDHHDIVTVAKASAGTGSAAPRELTVLATPNPATDRFVLILSSPVATPVQVRVIDAAGRVVESRQGVSSNGSVALGAGYRPGVYHVEVIQGNVKRTVRLVKQSH
ncbi:MAG: C-terminal target protein [Flaviaesturariibacter sp.]|nr:C-terminal target protein [Flaviaesturariibacter sp.]